MALVAVATATATATACGAATDPAGGVAGSSLPAPGTVVTSLPETTRPPGSTAPPTTGQLRDELAAARARWEASGITSYRVTQTPVCFCPRATVTAAVFAGRVVDRDGPYEALGVEE